MRDCRVVSSSVRLQKLLSLSNVSQAIERQYCGSSLRVTVPSFLRESRRARPCSLRTRAFERLTLCAFKLVKRQHGFELIVAARSTSFDELEWTLLYYISSLDRRHRGRLYSPRLLPSSITSPAATTTTAAAHSTIECCTSRKTMGPGRERVGAGAAAAAAAERG